MSHILTTTFGTFRGHKANNTTQYRGIKYASLADQLSVPKLVTTYSDDITDATRFGYASPPPSDHHTNAIT
jgi:carboxylesterase type B